MVTIPKEKKSEYNRRYRESHGKELKNTRESSKILCECGFPINKHYYSKHCFTQKHIIYVKLLNIPQTVEAY